MSLRPVSFLFVTLLLVSPIEVARGDDQESPSVRVMSFNIRYANRRDGPNVWPFRRHLVSGVVRHHRPAVVGVQEALWGQVVDLSRDLPEYGFFGSGRDGRAGGERCSIFYDRKRLELKRESTFWLSRHPDRVGADWGARLRRICTWGLFEDRESGKEFFVFNTHFDHQSSQAREESAKLILRQIEKIAGDEPVVFMGDLNAHPSSTPYRTLVDGAPSGSKERRPDLALRDAFVVSESAHYGPMGTFSGFSGIQQEGPRIDYIFVKNDVRVLTHSILPDAILDRTPSDHRPVVADLILDQPFVAVALQLHEGWRFAVDSEEVGEKEGWYRHGHDDSAWAWVRVGEPWERQGFEHDGVGWYRRSVVIPKSWEHEKVCLIANGIDDSFALYVNGRRVIHLGTRSKSFWDGRATIQLPNSVLDCGRENLFVFRVKDYDVWGGLCGYPLMLRTDVPVVSHIAKPLKHLTLVELRDFTIGQEHERIQKFPVEIPSLDGGIGWLRVGIRDAIDDSGDSGLTVHLEGEDGTTTAPSFFNGRGFSWVEHRVEEKSQWTVVVEDGDTLFEGEAPGNEGMLEVLLRVDKKRRDADIKTEASKRPRSVPEDAFYWNRHWYWISEDVMTFPEALELASSMKGKVVTVSSKEENDFLLQAIPGICWLGVQRVEGVWTILEKGAPPFFYWDAGEPNGSRDEIYCGLGFNLNGRWHDMLAGDRYYACIEWGRDR